MYEFAIVWNTMSSKIAETKNNTIKIRINIGWLLKFSTNSFLDFFINLLAIKITHNAGIYKNSSVNIANENLSPTSDVPITKPKNNTNNTVNNNSDLYFIKSPYIGIG